MSLEAPISTASRELVAVCCRLIKLGKRLAVGETLVHSETSSDPVSHATATYSIPPGAVEAGK